MNFQEAEGHYHRLRQQLAAGQITSQQFAAAMPGLRVQDGWGNWWQINGADGNWLRWNGAGWEIAAPPHRLTAPPAPVQAPPSAQPQPPAAPAAFSQPSPTPPQPQPFPPSQVAAPILPTPAPVQPPQPPMPTPPPASTSQAAPQTLAQLLVLLLKGMFKNWVLKLIMAGGVALFTLILHTYLLVGPNEGFGSGTSKVLDSLLALRDRVVTGTLVWTLAAMLISTFFGRLFQIGPAKTIQNIVSTPAWVVKSLKDGGAAGAALLLGLGAVTLLCGVLVGNVFIGLSLALLALGALISQQQSFIGVVARLSWSDSQRLFKPKHPRPFEMTWVGAGLTGATVGLFGATFLTFGASVLNLPALATYCGCASALLLLVAMIASIFIRRGHPTAGVTLLVLAVIITLALTATPVLADDGGWQEAGGTLSGWLQSQGAILAVLLGLPPAFGTLLGALLGSSIATLLPPDLINQIITQGLTTAQMADLRSRMNAIITQKIKDGYYVRNTGLPSKFWNNTFGWVWNEKIGTLKGGQCGEFGDWGAQWSRDAVKSIFGNDTIITDITAYRNPWVNHRATRIILPNGDRVILDYWESMPAGEAKIYPESEWIKRYQEKLGGSPTINRSEDEIFLEKSIRDYGKEKGLQIFRRSYRNNPTKAEILIKSYERDPWFNPNPPQPMRIPDLRNLNGRGPSIGGHRW